MKARKDVEGSRRWLRTRVTLCLMLAFQPSYPSIFSTNIQSSFMSVTTKGKAGTYWTFLFLSLIDSQLQVI